jgi:hypothetical protein
MFLWSRALPVRRTDNLAAMCEPIVWNLEYAQPIDMGGYSFFIISCFVNSLPDVLYE